MIEKEMRTNLAQRECMELIYNLLFNDSTNKYLIIERPKYQDEYRESGPNFDTVHQRIQLGITKVKSESDLFWLARNISANSELGLDPLAQVDAVLSTGASEVYRKDFSWRERTVDDDPPLVENVFLKETVKNPYYLENKGEEQ